MPASCQGLTTIGGRPPAVSTPRAQAAAGTAQRWWTGQYQEVRPPTVERTSSAWSFGQ
jgi:hypothetical protein